MQFINLVLVLVLGFLAAGSATSQELSDDDRNSLKKALQAFAEASLANDVPARAAMYTEDAVIMPGSGPIVEGRASIQAAFEGATILDFQYTIDAIEGYGEIASMRGSLTVTFGSEASEQTTVLSGSYFEIRQRQADGSWKYIRDAYAIYPVEKAEP